MGRYIARRLIQALVTLFAVMTATFFLFRVLPGDPTLALVGGDLPASAAAAMRERFGLDEPMVVQYWTYLVNAVMGDFGMSFWHTRPARDVLLERLGPTLLLGGTSFVLAYSASVLVASTMVLYHDRPAERLLRRAVLVLRSLPVFWTGVILIIVFSVQLQWLPHAGMYSAGTDLGGSFASRYLSLDLLAHMVLPVTAYSVYLLGLPTLVLRTTMLGEYGRDYVGLLRAKGLAPKRVVFAHVLRNSLLPFFTLAGLFVGLAVAGQIAIEYVFSWPGMGRALVSAVSRRDYPVAQAGFVFIAVTVVFVNAVVDVLYSFMDPRVKTGEVNA